jgi:hypothetical protein
VQRLSLQVLRIESSVTSSGNPWPCLCLHSVINLRRSLLEFLRSGVSSTGSNGTRLPIHTRGLCTHNSFLSSLASSRRGHLSRQSQTLWWSGSNGTPSSWALSSATSERCHTCFTALVRQTATSRALNGLQWYTSAPACPHFNLAHSSLCSCR